MGIRWTGVIDDMISKDKSHIKESLSVKLNNKYKPK